MTRAEPSAPPGYGRVSTHTATVVALDAALPDVLEAVRHCDTLHRWAERVPEAERFRGRGAAFGVRLPTSGIEVVVRHAQHGGLLAPLTGDLYRWPSRAPWELEASRRLRSAGVPTPELVAYALYPSGPGCCRCDVATRRLPAGGDLPERWLSADAAGRAALLAAVGLLLRALRAAGAVHEDLNVKNIYVADDGAALRAYALDVDRVRFSADDPTPANLARLGRSFRKARTQFGLSVSEDELAALDAMAAEPA